MKRFKKLLASLLMVAMLMSMLPANVIADSIETMPEVEITPEPVAEPTAVPTAAPTAALTEAPVAETVPVEEIEVDETEEPEVDETEELVVEETEEPVVQETEEPVVGETEEPVVEETEEPVVQETEEPVVGETEEPVVEETEEPVVQETEEPVVGETEEPDVETTEEPVDEFLVDTAGSAPVYKFSGYKTLEDFGIYSAAAYSAKRSSNSYLNPQTIRPSSSRYGNFVGDQEFYESKGRYDVSEAPFTATFDLSSSYMPQNSVYIAISNFDCDEAGDEKSCEYDQVYINNKRVGLLTGNNNTSNTTLLKVDKSILKAGRNTITIHVGTKFRKICGIYKAGQIINDISDTKNLNSTAWILRVDDIQILCDGGSSEGRPDSFRVNLTDSEVVGNQVKCYATTQIRDSKNRTFTLEYALYDWSNEKSPTYGQIIADAFATVDSNNYENVSVLTMPANSMSGNYTAVVFLKSVENGEENVFAYDEDTFPFESGYAPSFDVQNFTATPANMEWTSDPVTVNLSADINVNAGISNLAFYISDTIQTYASVGSDGHVTGTLDLSKNGFYTVELRYIKDGKAYKKTTTVEINNILTPLDPPTLNVTDDLNIIEGETVSIDWNQVENATAYSIIVWDFTNGADAATEVNRVNDQEGLTYSYTFNKAGAYIIGVYSRCPGSTKYCQSKTAGSVNVYVTECDHSGKNFEYVLDATIPALYIDTGDGENHYIINSYSCICKDCKGLVGTVKDEYLNAKTEAHTFDKNGACTRACGAVAEIPCQHENAKAYYDDGAQPPQFSNITETHHDVRNGYKMYCEDCKQYTGETGYFDAISEQHIFTNGDVCVCGYDRSACMHTPVAGSGIYIKTFFEAENSATHKAVADTVSYTCSKCYQAYEKTEARAESDVEKGIPHAWAKGICLSEGCGYVCVDHVWIINYDSPVVGSGEWVYVNENGHKRVSVEYEATCQICGKEGKERVKEEGSELKSHLWKWQKFEYKYNDTKHWKVGTQICSWSADGKQYYCLNESGDRYTRSATSIKIDHAFEDGVCECGYAEKKGIITPVDGASVALFDGESIKISWHPCEGAKYYQVVITDMNLTASVANRANMLKSAHQNADRYLNMGQDFLTVFDHYDEGEECIVYAARISADKPLEVIVTYDDLSSYYTRTAMTEDHTLDISVAAFG